MSKFNKKTALTIVFLVATVVASAQTHTSLLDRVNLGLSINTTSNPNLSIKSGLLRNNPSNALESSATIRLWNRVGIGGYLSLMGASPFAQASSAEYGTASGTTLYTISFDNGYRLGGGAYIELHRNRFDKRMESGQWMDIVLRGGFGLNGQADGLWGGVGVEYRITRHMLFFMYVDFGDFPFAKVYEITDNYVNMRTSFGMKFNL